MGAILTEAEWNETEIATLNSFASISEGDIDYSVIQSNLPNRSLLSIKQKLKELGNPANTETHQAPIAYQAKVNTPKTSPQSPPKNEHPFKSFDIESFLAIFPSSPIIDPIRKAFELNSNDNGDVTNGFLLPVSVTTGLGKTYSAAMVLFLYTVIRAKHDSKKRKTSILDPHRAISCGWYLTNLIDNVGSTHTELLKHIDSSAELNQEQKAFIRNKIHIFRGQGETIKHVLPNFQKIFDSLPLTSRVIRDKHRDLQNFLKGATNFNNQYVKDNIRNFFNALKKELATNYRNTHINQDFVSGLYSVRYDAYKLLPGLAFDFDDVFVGFMTTSKALYGIPRLLTHHNPFQEKSNLFFIDEFDAQSNVILGHLIEKRSLPLLRTLKHIAAELSETTVEKDDAYTRLDEVHQILVSELSGLKEHYRYSHGFDFDESTKQFVEESDASIFDDRIQNTISSHKKQLHYRYNSRTQKNVLSLSDHKANTSFHTHFINKVDTFVNSTFPSLIRSAAMSYMDKNRDSESFAKSNLDIQTAIRTILAALNLERYTIHVLERSVYRKSVHARQKRCVTGSHFERGCKFTQLGYPPNVHDHIEINHIALDVTPTALIINIVDLNNAVIGVSATAEAKTNIFNFDFPYIEQALGCRLLRLNNNEELAIQDYYNSLRPFQAFIDKRKLRFDVNFVNYDVTTRGFTGLIQTYTNSCNDPNQETQFIESLFDRPNDYQFLAGFLGKLFNAIGDFLQGEGRYLLCFTSRYLGYQKQKSFIEHCVQQIASK